MIQSGIYIITCVVSGKIYVGSSNNCRRRWNEHKKLLREDRHHSSHLQRAWNKYGSDSFLFKMVEEIIDESTLLPREQCWIDSTKSYDGEHGYNGRREADSGAWITQYKSKTYIIRFPDGSEKTVKNLSRFSRKHNLNQGALSAVARHLTNHHQNIHCRFVEETYEQWQLEREKIIADRPKKKPPEPYTTKWRITDPDGLICTTDSLMQYCQERNLSQGNMSEVARGNRKQHKGYTCEIITCS